MTNTTRQHAIIADSLQRARLKRAIRYMQIDEPVTVADGVLTRLSNRQVRYDLRGVSVKFTAMWDRLVDYLLLALELDTEAAQAERRERVAEVIADMKAEEAA